MLIRYINNSDKEVSGVPAYDEVFRSEVDPVLDELIGSKLVCLIDGVECEVPCIPYVSPAVPAVTVVPVVPAE